MAVPRTLEAEVPAGLAGSVVEPAGRRSGFSAAVEGAPAEGYRAPRAPAGPGRAADDAPGAARRPIGIVTGELGAHVLAPLVPALAARAGTEVRLVPGANRFFGGNIGVPGLLGGAERAAQR